MAQYFGLGTIEQLAIALCTVNWQPIRRKIIVELVNIGQESFIDDGASRSLRFDRVD